MHTYAGALSELYPPASRCRVVHYSDTAGLVRGFTQGYDGR